MVPVAIDSCRTALRRKNHPDNDLRHFGQTVSKDATTRGVGLALFDSTNTSPSHDAAGAVPADVERVSPRWNGCPASCRPTSTAHGREE